MDLLAIGAHESAGGSVDELGVIDASHRVHLLSDLHAGVLSIAGVSSPTPPGIPIDCQCSIPGGKDRAPWRSREPGTPHGQSWPGRGPRSGRRKRYPLRESAREIQRSPEWIHPSVGAGTRPTGARPQARTAGWRPGASTRWPGQRVRRHRRRDASTDVILVRCRAPHGRDDADAEAWAQKMCGRGGRSG